MPILEFLLRLLPLDARGRRTADEVLADWRLEARQARSDTARFIVHLRGASALAGALLLVAIRELGSIPSSGMIVTTTLWLVVPLVGMVLLGVLLLGLLGARYPSEPWLVAALAQTYLMWTLPLALFAGAHRAGRRRAADVPYLGFAMTAFVIPTLLQFWLLPALGRPSDLPHLTSTFSLPPDAAVARERLLIGQLRLSLLCLGPTLIILAGSLRPFAAWQSRVAPFAIAVAYVALLLAPALVHAIGLPIGIATHLGPSLPWLLPAAVAAGIVLATARRPDSPVAG